MRHTEVTPEELASDKVLQEKLDKFWNLIENHYEDEWRVEISGAVVLHVTEELLTRVLSEHYVLAELEFEAYEQHNPETERYKWTNFPEYLIGLYSIEGIYNERQALVNGTRTYFFEQGY